MTRHNFDLDVRGFVDVSDQLALLDIPPKLRRRLLNNVAKRVRSLSRQRVRKQEDIDGSAFAPRKTKVKGKKKMESGLAKLLEVTNLSADQAVLGWRNGLTRWIAAQQHNGSTERRTAAQMRRWSSVPSGIAASEKQAKRLRRLGFKARTEGKRGLSRPSIAWIQGHISYAQAGLIIRILTDGNTESSGAKSWDITVPKRAFLGASEQETRLLVSQVLNQILNSPR